MDTLNREILALLMEDSRASYRKMADELNISEGAVRQRVKQLIQTGIIHKFTIETSTDYPKAMIFISTSPTIPTSRVAKKVACVKGVISAVEVAGEYDISATISGENVFSVNQTIDAIREVEGVQNTKTLFVLRIWK